ncbi:PQQ-dependent sugar dehydrogenase [Candidatus Woesearchaeota archaeon]|nr:PQQ-dependent sugar dehydrogenase [Candidatus Woesearchaeota archaeon]
MKLIETSLITLTAIAVIAFAYYYQGSPAALEIVADSLETPWEIEFLPDGDILITQRPGSLTTLKGNKQINVQGVEQIGEGGLLGMALHPKFEENKWIYLYSTTGSGNGITNRVERFRLINGTLTEKSTLISEIPGAQFHDGGRIAFGPDGYLYVGTGDATEPMLSQDTGSLAGKILRVKEDGTIPEDNPFGNAVYSYGHRNVQGLAWDSRGRMWATEHGSSAKDELNIIIKGGNYGWPTIKGDEKKEGMITPIIHSGEETWAPSGLAHIEGKLLFAGLRGEAIYEADIDNKTVKAHFKNEFGRLRTIKKGPDNKIYVLTSNRDGRTIPRKGDDKVIKLSFI